MKYIFSFLLSVIVIFSSITTSFASENISFTLQSNECKINRLFTVDMIAKSDKPLSAATFELIYDSEMFEYRSVKVSDDESQISAHNKNGCVTAVFLNTYGKNINDETTIFSITFKAIKSGTGYIDFNVKECVDKNVEWINIGKCASSQIIVEATKTEASSKKENSKSEKTESSGNKKKSERSTQPTTISSTIDEFGNINNDVENINKTYLIIGFAFGCGIIALILLISGLVKKYIIKNTDNKSSA